MLRLALVGIAAAVAGSPQHVIAGDRSAGGILAGQKASVTTTLFGEPSGYRTLGPYTCVMTWRKIGLTVEFLSVDEHPCTNGTVNEVTVNQRASWRTDRGLRVGDLVTRLRKLYPRAALHGSKSEYLGWWLITRPACEEENEGPHPGLLAHVSKQRVASIVLLPPGCD
jgi:hypothetical protein